VERITVIDRPSFNPSVAERITVIGPPSFNPSPVYDWVGVLLDVTAIEVARNNARPTIISRNVYVTIAAMFQGWAAYDDTAVGTEIGDSFRRPKAERTTANKAKAVAFAAYRAMFNVYPDDKAVLEKAMTDRGLDPNDTSTDPSTPAGVGNAAAKAVIDSRRKDGSNQYGDEPKSNGKPYSDYTGYTPQNTPDEIKKPDHWQPLPVRKPDGTVIAQEYLTPHWGLVRPFGLKTSSQFRPGPQPKVGSADIAREVRQVILENATLSVEKKAIVEYMRDGPRSTSQSGQWLTLGQFISARDRNDLDRDMKMYFALAAVGMDAFISSWETKRYYDSSRPWTLVRHYCAGGRVFGWGGPGRGTMARPASEWHPYSPENFVTPPFPGYVSGHSTVSGGSARMLELFTGSDDLGFSIEWQAGSLTEEGFPCYAIQQVDGQPLPPVDLDCSVTLRLQTLTSVAEMAGISRIYGGFHIQTDNIAGLVMGRKIANHHWPIIQSYYNGTAKQ